MAIWIALLVAPLLALADQGIAFSLVGWSCAHQSMLFLHLCHSLFLVLVAGTAIAASLAWRRTRAGTEANEQLRQHHFLAGVATVVSALSLLTVIAMWLPTWMVSACIA